MHMKKWLVKLSCCITTNNNIRKLVCLAGISLLFASVHLKNQIWIAKEPTVNLTRNFPISNENDEMLDLIEKVPIYEQFIKITQPGSNIPPEYARDVPSSELSVEYTLLPNVVSHKNQQKKILSFFVKSAATNLSRRKMIRKTWGSISEIEDYEIMLVFLVGSASKYVNKAIKEESECYQDILQTSFVDTFKNLTLKTLSTFKWIKDNMKNSLYYIFTDDDCVIDLYSTISFLDIKTYHGKPRTNSIYCGFAYENHMPVVRNTETFNVPVSQYSLAEYPAFCRGVMVILTYEMIKSLYNVSTRTNYATFPFEDIMVYGILRSKLNQTNVSISPVINGAHKLVFYSYDNSALVVKKMHQRWSLIDRYSFGKRKSTVKTKTFNMKTCLNYLNL